VIMNPAAGSAASSGPLHDRLAAIPDLTVRQTCAMGQARAVAREAIREGYELVVAAGGDGTVNEVVQGLSADLDRATLGVLPLGTGNDLARSLGMPFNPIEALEILTNNARERERERKIDLIRVDTVHDPVYCVNIAAGGFSGQWTRRSRTR
jgi:diacylglycerol kinase (ATP)